MILTDDEISGMWLSLPAGQAGIANEFARAIEAAILKKIGEPVAWLFDTDQEALLPEEIEPGPFKARPELYAPLYKLPELTK